MGPLLLLLSSLHIFQLERCESLRSSKSFLLGCCCLFKGLVLLYQVLDLVDGLSKLVGLEVGVLGNQPGFGHSSVPDKLVELQDQLQMLPPLLPPVNHPVPLVS